MFKTCCALVVFLFAIGCAEPSQPLIDTSEVSGGAATPEETADDDVVDVASHVTEAEPQGALATCTYQGTVCDSNLTACRHYMNSKCGPGYYGECNIKSADCGGTSLTRYDTYCCR